jgi:hypothetical protein
MLSIRKVNLIHTERHEPDKADVAFHHALEIDPERADALVGRCITRSSHVTKVRSHIAPWARGKGCGFVPNS